MNGHDLTNKVVEEIKNNNHHELSLETALEYISFFGLYEIATSIGSCGQISHINAQEAIKALERGLESGRLKLT